MQIEAAQNGTRERRSRVHKVFTGWLEGRDGTCCGKSSVFLRSRRTLQRIQQRAHARDLGALICINFGGETKNFRLLARACGAEQRGYHGQCPFVMADHVLEKELLEVSAACLSQVGELISGEHSRY